MPNLTPLEAAEVNLNTAKYLEDMIEDVKHAMKGPSVEDWLLKVTHEDVRQLAIAASYLRKIDTGEYVPIPKGFPIEVGQRVGRWKIVGANYLDRTIMLKKEATDHA